MTGMTLGTMSYLSPEQATGSELGPASDVYGLGLVLLECVTGRPAFTGTMAEVATARLVSAPDVPVDLDPRLGDLLARMTRIAPQERPDAREVAQDLAAILAGASGETLVLPAEQSPRPESDPQPSAVGGARPRSSAVPSRAPVPRVTPRRRHAGGRIALAGGALALLVGGAVLVGQVAAGDGSPSPTVVPVGRGPGGRVPHPAARERRAMTRASSRLIRWTIPVAVVLAVHSLRQHAGAATDRAQALQESVLSVTQAASEARWADAQVLLAETQTALDAGADAGEVSTARYREIDAALDRVAADVAAAQAAADQAAAAQAAEQAAAAQAAEQAAAEQAAAEQAAAEKKAGPAPAKEQPAPKDKGPGKGGK